MTTTRYPTKDQLLELGIQRNLNHRKLFEEILIEGDVSQRIVVARGLGWMRSSLCTPALLTALNDSHSEVRRWVVASLSLSWENSAEKVLLDYFIIELEDRVRAAILRTLGWHRLKNSGELCIYALKNDSVHEVRAEAVRALGRIDADVYLDQLIEATMDSSFLVRRYAIRAILNQPEDQILNILLERINDEDAETRAVAIRGLTYLTGDEITERLIYALDDCNPCVRANAVIALGHRGGSVSLNILKNKYNDPHPEVRCRVREAIVLLTGKKFEKKINI